jgi:hypothetical protein
MVQDRKGEARRALAPLLAQEHVAAEDLLRAANIELSEEKVGEAVAFVEEASKLAADDPVAIWCRYRIARIEFQNERALRILDPLVQARPDDYALQLAYTLALDDIEDPESEARAEERYRELMEVPAEIAGSWIVVVLERMRQLLMYAGKRDEAMVVVERLQELRNRDVKSPGEPAHQAGTLGEVLPHTRRRFTIATPTLHETTLQAHQLSPDAVGFATGRTGRGKILKDVGKAFGSVEELFTYEPSPLRIAAFGPKGLELFGRDSGRSWQGRKLSFEPITDVLTFDRMNTGAKPSDTKASGEPGDQELDLLVSIAGKGTFLFENVDGVETPASMSRQVSKLFPQVSTRSGGLIPVDYDHDGDCDLLLSNDGSAALFRNDGFDVDPEGLTDVTRETTLTECPFHMIPEDLDRDSDIDFVVLDERVKFLSSLRAGRFERADDELPEHGFRTKYLVAADLDGDSWVDLALFGEDLSIHLRTETGSWRSQALTWPLGSAPTGQPIVCDWDLDGTNDLLWPTATHPAAGLLAAGFENGGVALLLGEKFSDSDRPGRAQIAALDLDGDGDHDLLRAGQEGGLWEYLFEGNPRGALVELMGHKDSSLGVGAILEMRRGRRYRRILWRGQPQLIGMNGEMPELIRIRWPNAVVQNHFDAPFSDLLFWQRRGLAGSCPFLYTWNGETYEFISDVLGITPLGLPMAPGQLVQPDHDEYVLVRGDQLVQRDGVYELQFTEELREVTYLDRIRLDVVDHPAEVEIFPEERFSFPPFPAPHTHTLRDPLAATKATGSDGEDWTAELAADDRTFAQPFVTRGGQFRGLTEPHFLELTFDGERVRNATKLRLALNGWLVWSDASVNVAAARHPEKAFIPPILQIPDGEGGWKDAGPPLGFPAGKLKTMVIDVTSMIDRGDPRIRIFSTLVIYWDSIRLATDPDDAPLIVTPIEPLSAEIFERGFSEPFPFAARADLEWFSWERVSERPRWNQHPGFYTRYGDAVPLLTDIDDRFVILGAGDAMTVRFDASQAPPLQPGWKRDFLVFFDGWAKDRDPNTERALFVKPLPFHGMSGYPYGPDEAFPDTEAHRTWEREWNTRPAKQWIESLAPPRRAARASSDEAREAGYRPDRRKGR